MSDRGINQLESLNIPQPQQQARSIYVSENIFGYIHEKKVFLTQLDPHGFHVCCLNGEIPKLAGKPVTVTFKSPEFTTRMVLKNKGEMTYRGRKVPHYEFIHENSVEKRFRNFADAIPQDKVWFRHRIQPLFHVRNPFFRDEIKYFDILAATPEGVIVRTFDHNSGLIPDQPLKGWVTFPGLKTMALDLTVIPSVYQSKTDYRYFFRFKNPGYLLQQSLSTYLLGFCQSFPNALRQSGFNIGDLSHLVSYEYGVKSSAKNSEYSEVASPGLDIPQSSKSISKSIAVYLSGESLAQGTLVFVGSEGKGSVLNEAGYDLPSRVTAKPYLEFCELQYSSKVNLRDFFIPILKQVTLVAFQNDLSHVIMESSSKYTPVLEKLGWKIHKKEVRRRTKKFEKYSSFLCEFPVNNVLSQNQKSVDAEVWKKVYRGMVNRE